MRQRCLCQCHEGSVSDRRRADGVDARDPIEAVTARGRCVNNHCVALLDERDNASWYAYDNGEFRSQPLSGTEHSDSEEGG